MHFSNLNNILVNIYFKFYLLIVWAPQIVYQDVPFHVSPLCFIMLLKTGLCWISIFQNGKLRLLFSFVSFPIVNLEEGIFWRSSVSSNISWHFWCFFANVSVFLRWILHFGLAFSKCCNLSRKCRSLSLCYSRWPRWHCLFFLVHQCQWPLCLLSGEQHWSLHRLFAVNYQ